MTDREADKIIFKSIIETALNKRGYIIPKGTEWADIEPLNFQDDALISAAILILEEL